MAAKKKTAAKKTKKPARKPATKAAKKVVVKKAAAAKRKPVAKKVAKKAAKKKSARAKITPARLRAAAPKITPFDDRIAMARDNLRQLVEQAASSAGAANEELLAQRISSYEDRLKDLYRQRDDYIKKTR